MSEATTPAPAAGAAEPKKKSKLILIVALAALLLAAGGGGYWFFVLRPKAAEAKGARGGKGEKDEKAKKAGGKKADAGEEEQGDEEDGEEESAEGQAASNQDAVKKQFKLELPDDKEVKKIIELPPFIVNLADEGEAYYLRLSVSVGVGGEGEEKPDPLFTTRVRNAMLAVLTTKTSADVLTQEGKSKLRKELLKAARAASAEPRVEAIYITDLIVQL
jgi:flagellar protein FliL